MDSNIHNLNVTLCEFMIWKIKKCLPYFFKVWESLKDLHASGSPNVPWTERCARGWLEEAMENYILCYDNMCQLGSLKAAKDELPLPPPYHMTWRNITKIIDRLHLANHKNPQCKELYSADNALPPGYNTMVVFSFQEDSQLDIPNTSPILHSSEHQMKKWVHS